MFFAEAQIRVHLYGKPADMRKSYDGLQALARHAMDQNPLDGSLYCFRQPARGSCFIVHLSYQNARKLEVRYLL